MRNEVGACQHDLDSDYDDNGGLRTYEEEGSSHWHAKRLASLGKSSNSNDLPCHQQRL